MQLLVVLCGLLVLASAQNPFIGTWTSSYGGAGEWNRFYFCEVDGSTQGVYSEVGFVYGTVEKNSSGIWVFSGEWWEAGKYGYQDAPDQSPHPNYGPIILSMSADNQSWSGIYAYNGEGWDPEFVWPVNTLINGSSPDVNDCWASSALNGTVDGSWVPSVCADCSWDLCESGNSISGSYDFTDYSGFTFGNCFLNGTLCTLNWYETSGYSGIYIVRLLSDLSFIASYWSGSITDFEWNDDPPIEQHSIDTYSRPALNSGNNCTRYSELGQCSDWGDSCELCSQAVNCGWCDKDKECTAFLNCPSSGTPTTVCSSRLPTWQLGLIIGGSLLGFGLIVIVIVLVLRRRHHRHRYTMIE